MLSQQCNCITACPVFVFGRWVAAVLIYRVWYQCLRSSWAVLAACSRVWSTRHVRPDSKCQQAQRAVGYPVFATLSSLLNDCTYITFYWILILLWLHKNAIHLNLNYERWTLKYFFRTAVLKEVTSDRVGIYKK